VTLPAWKIDSRRWPLALLYIEGGDGSVQPSAESVIACFEELSSRPARRAVVADFHFSKPDAARRKPLIDWIKAHWASVRTQLIALAIVAPSTFQRNLITVVQWFVDLRCPIEVFDRRELAIAWAEEQLRKAGIAVPR
jgi:hypothetical protein